jgi:hypothetical protein
VRRRSLFCHRGLGAASGRNQTKKLKCKTQNFGIPASRDNSLLSKQLRQPCRKNTHKNKKMKDCSTEGLARPRASPFGRNQKIKDRLLRIRLKADYGEKQKAKSSFLVLPNNE